MPKKIEKRNYDITGVEFIVYSDNIIEVIYKRATESLQENDEETSWINDQFQEIAKKNPDNKYLILLDVTGPGSSEQLSEEAKNIYIALLKDDRIKKVAVFGQTWGFQLIVDLLAAISRTKKLRSFPDRKKAVAWLTKK